MPSPRSPRRQRLITVLSIAAVVVVGIVVNELFLRHRDPPDPQPTSTAAPARPADAFAMTVRYVYDGDTFQAQIAEPSEIVTTTAPIRIRLIGIDTPEGTPEPECGADAARDRLRELLPEGSTVWLAADEDTWDDYDRRLFYAWTQDGVFVNYDLVAGGHAEAIRVWPNVEHVELFREVEEAARAAGVGRWGSC